jgi:hypothetical protein
MVASTRHTDRPAFSDCHQKTRAAPCKATQLLFKGSFHHRWKSRIVTVLQDHVYVYIRGQADFRPTINIQGRTLVFTVMKGIAWC